MRTQSDLLPHFRKLPFWWGLVGGVLGVMAIWLGLLMLTTGHGGSAVALGFGEYLRVKTAAISGDSSMEQRLIILGGSSSFYGISAAEIAAGTGKKVVNFGTHAALPFHVMVSRIRPRLRQGDTILLVLEYQYYRGVKWNDTASDIILSQDLGVGVATLPLEDQFFLLMSAPLQKRFRYLMDSQTAESKEAKHSQEQARFRINEFGDFVGHSKLNAPEVSNINEAPLEVFENLKENSEIPGWEEVSEFVKWCHTQGIRVIATFPTMLANAAYYTPAGLSVSQRLVDAYHSLGVGVIGTPHSRMVSRDEIYDTEYHINYEAALEHTRAILPDLAIQMGLSPEMLNLQSRNERRSEPFFGFDRVEGLGPVEGPYDGLPFQRFRIAKYPEITLELTHPEDASDLAITLSPITSKQGVSIFCNDVKVVDLSVEFGKKQKFLVPLPQSKGSPMTIKLVFSEKFDDRANHRAIAAYFESIQIRSRSSTTTMPK